ncbi:MAG: fatty acid--CoA ligase family protein [Marivibrio sp.]|uniref:class I adenylate-forming enzyme family protein n=1 Tax=Marivibrio sp. TaxID=2039719 RepID=UPI0032F035FF
MSEAAPDLLARIMGARGGGVVDALGALTMDELQDAAAAGARALAEAGARPAEPVLVPIRGRGEDLAALLATLGAGAVAVPVHEGAHADTLSQIAATTGARLTLGPGRRDARVPLQVTSSGGAAPPDRPMLDGAAAVLFTSGSTGAPKGVVIGRDRFSAKLSALDAALRPPRDPAVDPDGAPVTILPLQLVFIFGQWVAFLTLMRGGTLHLADGFDAAAIARRLAEDRVDYLAAVPTMLRRLLAERGGDRPVDILTGGEAVSGPLIKSLLDHWPAARVHSLYGLTETGSCDLFRRDDARDPTAAARDGLGRPGAGVAVRTDPATGELQIRTPYAMLGYLDRPELTAETLADGWVRTGDAAEIAEDGSVRLTGRLKELINRAGNKISPLEIESLFTTHPAVSLALCAGLPDARLGEAIHLLIVPKAGGDISADALLRWAEGRIERFKRPDHIHFATEVPLGRTGKADRAALARLIRDGALGAERRP